MLHYSRFHAEKMDMENGIFYQSFSSENFPSQLVRLKPLVVLKALTFPVTRIPQFILHKTP